MKISEEAAAWLRAALDGKTVQWRLKDNPRTWHDATDFSKDASLLVSEGCEVRIKPDVIVVNGIEVPAPVKIPPPPTAEYWIAAPGEDCGFMGPYCWTDSTQSRSWLALEIMHPSPEAAAAHGKAMRAHKPG